MKSIPWKRIAVLTVVTGAVLFAIEMQPSLTNAAEEGISKMNSVLNPAKPPQLDAEMPKNLQTATFALG
jgi:hypothetical protein